jgi:hypothetical protein
MPTTYHNFRGDPFGLEDKYPDWEIKAKQPDPGQKPMLVSFGDGGHRVDWNKNCHQSGYEKPETFFCLSHWWAHKYLDYVDPVPYEGVPWVDKRAAIGTPRGFSWVFRGPMCNPELPVGKIDRLPEPDEMTMMMLHPINKAILLMGAATAKVQPAGSLDYVDIQTYIKGWMEHGAVGGFIRDGYFIVEPYAKGTIYHHYQDVYKRHGRKAARAMECASESGVHWWLFMHCSDKQIADFCSWYGVKETRIYSDHDCTGKWFSGAPTIRRSGHRVLVTLSWGYDI